MLSTYPIAVTLHVLAAIVWVGGALFMGAVAVPVARQLPDEQRHLVVGRIGYRFRPVGWAALVTLWITGIWLVLIWGGTWASLTDGSFYQSPQGAKIGIKFVVVALMTAVTAVHDWWLGPRSSAMRHDDPGLPAARRVAGLLGMATAALSLVIVLLAIHIARPHL